MKEYTKTLYDWISQKSSRLRMMMGWQAAGGLPYVSGTHLLGIQCFVNYGNAYHNTVDRTVSLEAFQKAVLKRHEMEHQGHTYLTQEDAAEEYK